MRRTHNAVIFAEKFADRSSFPDTLACPEAIFSDFRNLPDGVQRQVDQPCFLTGICIARGHKNYNELWALEPIFTAIFCFRGLAPAHGGLDILHGAWDGGGEVFAAGFRHQAIVFQAEADAPVLVVHADIHAEGHVGGDDFRPCHHIVDIVAGWWRPRPPWPCRGG